MINWLKAFALLSLLLSLYTPLQAKDVTVGGDRPALLKLPPTYDARKSYPLILLLHGRGASAQIVDLYLGLSRSQPFHDYLLLLPEGTVRDDGQKVWNATEQCCATNNRDVDDSGYLQDLVHEVTRKYQVDPKRIYIYGHSNGGFMAYRLACDTDGLFTGIVSLAGSEFADPRDCKTSTPINILQIHGTDDTLVPFEAEAKGLKYPGAQNIVARWAERNQCQQKKTRYRSLNLVFIKLEPGLTESGKPTIVGDLSDYLTLGFLPETDEYLHESCQDDVKVGLWKINGSNHAPVFIGKDFVGKTLRFMDSK